MEEVESEDDDSSGGVPYWINSLLIHFLLNQLKAKPNLVRPLKDDSQVLSSEQVPGGVGDEGSVLHQVQAEEVEQR